MPVQLAWYEHWSEEPGVGDSTPPAGTSSAMSINDGFVPSPIRQWDAKRSGWQPAVSATTCGVYMQDRCHEALATSVTWVTRNFV